MITAEIYAEAKAFIYNLYVTRPHSGMAFRKLDSGYWLQMAWNSSVLSWSLTHFSEPLLSLRPGLSFNASDFPKWPEAEA